MIFFSEFIGSDTATGFNDNEFGYTETQQLFDLMIL